MSKLKGNTMLKAAGIVDLNLLTGEEMKRLLRISDEASEMLTLLLPRVDRKTLTRSERRTYDEAVAVLDMEKHLEKEGK